MGKSWVPRPWSRLGRSAVEAALMLDEVVTTLGRCELDPSTRLHTGHRLAATVPIEQIVGSVARHGDFDRDFTPRRRELRERRDHLATLGPAVTATAVALVRVGELYFVEDGHHRVSLARARGQLALDASVRSICTVAWACACLTRGDLADKAAERDFLAEVPLPDPALRQLWLDDPAGYGRLADAARAWSDHAGHTCPDPDCVMDTAAAAAWWDLEVLPLARVLADLARGRDTDTTGEPSPADRYLSTLSAPASEPRPNRDPGPAEAGDHT
ncbi:hypothetical protein [Actinomycetospora sp. NBC_00405]|uniref:hypothetical protein n=1 Tax=Actinomycetospora sp. NBC_00405 TaxID=2975952 RepID=UPI002E1B77D4